MKLPVIKAIMITVQAIYVYSMPLHKCFGRRQIRGMQDTQIIAKSDYAQELNPWGTSGASAGDVCSEHSMATLVTADQLHSRDPISTQRVMQH